MLYISILIFLLYRLVMFLRAFLSTIEIFATMLILRTLRCIIASAVFHDFPQWAFFSTVFHNIEVFSTFIHPALARKFRLWQLWKMFLIRTIWLIPANGRVSNMVAFVPPRRLNGLVLLVIGGRSNAYCAVLAGLQYSVLPLIGCAASFTCAGHFLAFTFR